MQRKSTDGYGCGLMSGSGKRTRHFLIAFRESQHLFNDLGNIMLRESQHLFNNLCSILDKLGAECVE